MACKVVKKGLVGAAPGAAVLGLLFGVKAPSYVRTAFHKVRHDAQGAVPVEFEIQRARDAVAALKPAMEDNLENIIRTDVEIEYLDREVASTRENLAREKREMVALRDDLKAGEYKVGSTTYTPDELKSELARRFDRYTHGKQMLEKKESIVKSRRLAVAAARDQLRKMADQKQALLAQIEAIEARLKQIEATRAGDEFNLDDSALARARADVSDLEKRVEVMARYASERGKIADKSVPVILDSGRDVVREIDEEFGPGGKAHDKADKDL